MCGGYGCTPFKEFNDFAKVVAILRERKRLRLPEAKEEAREICAILGLETYPTGRELYGWDREAVAALVLE